MADSHSSVPPEEWRPIDGFPDYDVSNLGRVRSRARGRRQRVLSAKPNNMGYPQVSLCRPGEYKKRLVHHLVLEAFVGPRPLKHEGAHGDGDRANNDLRNLRWATSAENSADMIRHGTSQAGERNWNAKLTSEQADYVRRSQKSSPSLAIELGVRKQAIINIRSGNSWKHLGDAPRPPKARAKLSANAVQAIRRRVKGGESTAVLAKEYGVHRTTITALVYRNAWRHA